MLIRRYADRRVTNRDDKYFEVLASSIRVCADYKPKFGTGGTSD